MVFLLEDVFRRCLNVCAYEERREKIGSLKAGSQLPAKRLPAVCKRTDFLRGSHAQISMASEAGKMPAAKSTLGLRAHAMAAYNAVDKRPSIPLSTPNT